MPALPEPWLRGPIDGVPPLLMPAAHALLQVREDAAAVVATLTVDELWIRPGGAASAGYHLRHLAGALDRLLTYARGETLDPAAIRALHEEQQSGLDGPAILADVERAIDAALEQIRNTSADRLLEPRSVGRQQLPSNVIGLVFHAAEHASRHAGQAVTTAKIVRTLPRELRQIGD